MKNSDRTQLRWIAQGGATPRILDLWSINRRFGNTAEHAAQPFFRNARLNSSFIIKHTVRAADRPYLWTKNPVVTKVIVPVSVADLASGGHSFLVEERGFDQRFQNFLGTGSGARHFDTDLARLKELAELPSFDPFLLADRYADCAQPVARLYFTITEANQAAMRRHVAEQMAGFVGLAVGSSEMALDDERALRFAEQLMQDGPSESMDQLRATLGLNDDEFAQGIFGWKGTLYYRWSLHAEKDELLDFLRELNALTVSNASISETRQINKLRRAILTEVRLRWRALRARIDEYDQEFARFCQGGDASAMRHFLPSAPSYFRDLGSDLGTVTHVTSFWKYWWSGREKGCLTAADALEIFPSFLRSLTRNTEPESGAFMIA